ncbi:unnamed protein product [Camellia sinensis]
MVVRCESCGAAEPGTCEGHFGYIELPIPVYHPSHVSELKRLLSLVCFKCLKLRSGKLIQRARPILIDPGLYHSQKSGVFWAKEKRSMPSSFKLFMGIQNLVV